MLLSNVLDDKYYLNEDGIIFSSNNLKLAKNTIQLKIDGYYSNYIIVSKE
jgi:hypothetical protein